MGLGQVQTALNFYTYGKGEFTQSGYAKHARSYGDGARFHEGVDLRGKVFMVTGANSGIGREISQYLVGKGGEVWMVCRSRERGEKARQEVSASAEGGGGSARLLICDVGVDSDVRSLWRSFVAESGGGRLDGLVCNAGALLSERTLNADGVEVTFASHLAFGAFLLGKLAMPTLRATEGARLVLVTSGGMYNSSFPSWETATSTANDSIEKYDGSIAYTWAKRGQVLLAEEWAKSFPEVKIVSAHPGWTATEGVDAALAKTKHLLEPMRTPWEGSEGICWLLAAPAEAIESGALYLDRTIQKKHIAGAFWTEGNRTKNSRDEIAMMMLNLERITDETSPLIDVWRSTPDRILAKLASRANMPRLQASRDPIDIHKFMGKWNVLANIPIFLMNEHNLYNPVENYEWDEKNSRVQVIYNYYVMGQTELGEARQHGFIQDKQTNTEWKLNPKVGIYLPLGLGYLVLYCAPDYSWTLIGVPDRKFLWVMTRSRPQPKDPAPFPVDADPAQVQASKEKGLVSSDSMDKESILSPDEEAQIMREALLKAEAFGYDISQVRLCGWYPEVPYP